MKKIDDNPAKPAASPTAIPKDRKRVPDADVTAATHCSIKNQPTADASEACALAQKILMLSLNGIYIYDVMGAVHTFINPQYTRLTGYTLADLQAIRGAEFYELFHPEDQRRVAAHMERIGRAGEDETLEIEYRFKTADGRWMWCLSRDAVFERDEQGSVCRTIGTFMDLSGRKAAEIKLGHEHELLQKIIELETIYDSAPIGLCVFDRRFHYVRINNFMAELNGVAASKHLGRTPRDILPDLAGPIEEIFKQVLTSGQPVLDFEITGATAARPGVQRTAIVHWLPLKDPAGQVIGVNVVAEDVTERKRVEEALRKARNDLKIKIRKRTAQLQASVTALENEMQARKALENQLRQWSRVFMDAADPIIIEDLSGTIIDMNREAEREYAWRRHELIGKSIRSLIPSTCYIWADRLRERCRRGEEVRNWEGLRQDQKGRILSVLVTAFPLLDESGKIVSLATIAKDITRRKQVEKELENSRRYLRELSRKSIEALENDRRTTAKELHDSIGASLAAIKFKLEGTVEEIAQEPQKAAASLAESIAYLQAAIKETKQISANLRPTILDDLGLLSTITWYMRQFTEQYGHIKLIPQIEVPEEDIPGTLKIVIYRVLQESLHNAAKHSEATEVCIGLKSDSDRILLEIADNGRGFDVPKTLGRQDPMTGYGLASIQERAEIAGGSLTIDSSPGKGTRIRMNLALSPYDSNIRLNATNRA